MTKFQQNITQYIKKLKSMANSQEKVDRNYYKEGQKIHIRKRLQINCLKSAQALTQIMCKDVKETRSTMHKQQKMQKKRNDKY